MGLVAIGCVLGIGSYIIAFYWTIYSAGYGPDPLLLTMIYWILVLASASILVYGSFKILRKSALRGSLANTMAGIAMAILWLRFYYGFPLLTQLGFLTLLLFLPALLSAFLGFVSLRSQSVSRSEKENKNLP
jgi:apolipoprotein N-acyltransferase